MSSTLHDFQQIVTYSVSNELLTFRARECLIASTERLPCVARTLLECRLLASDDRVDLSQSFVREDSEVLTSYLQQAGPEDSGWKPVYRFLEEWCTPDSALQRAILGVWLELDLAAEHRGPPALPSLFLHLAPVDSGEVTLAHLKDVLSYILDIFGAVESSLLLFRALDNCVEQLPAGVVPSYVGLMLSRQPFSLRAQFSGFTQKSLLEFLESIQFEDGPESLPMALDISDKYFQSFVFCIDLIPGISPRIGIELFPSQYRGGMNDSIFLADLVSRGLCSDEKRHAVLAWPCRMEPGGDNQNWPEQLLIQSLLKPSDQFGLIERRINHIKLVSTPGHPVEAKIYLAANHLWASFTGDNALARDE